MPTPKQCILTILFCTLALSCFRLHAADVVDYQKTADGAGWGWLPEMDNPLGCVAQCGGKYDVNVWSVPKTTDTPSPSQCSWETEVYIHGKVIALRLPHSR